MKENRLNDLNAQEWLKFTKTWFIHNPPPRKGKEKLHPAKYPEGMIEQFIRFFTKVGEIVLDPFLGTGSTLIACHESGRNGIGVELIKKYAWIAQGRVKGIESQQTLLPRKKTKQRIIRGDSIKINQIWKRRKLPQVDFVITSPPYGPMLKKKGLVQAKRAEKGLDLKYSEKKEDLGNLDDYNEFIDKLSKVFFKIKDILKEKGYLVVIIQNYMDGGAYKTLAWDLAKKLSEEFTLRGERLWLQNNKTLYPYGYLYSFVPNVHHHYCLVFKNLKNF